MATTSRPLGPGVQRTQGGYGDPIPTTFRMSSLNLPREYQLEPGAAGQFESTVNKHRISAAAAQELIDQHIGQLKHAHKRIHDDADAARDDYWKREVTRYKGTPGSAEKIKAAGELMKRYERAHGKAAHDAARRALDRDAAYHGSVIDLLAFASDPARFGGGASKGKGARRYGAGMRIARRIIEILSDWLRPGREPAYASQQESAHG